jgi:hypothetical protein
MTDRVFAELSSRLTKMYSHIGRPPTPPLQDALDQLGRPVGRVTDARALRAQLEDRVRDWRALLRKHTEQGQQLLRRLIVGRLTVTPEKDAEGRYYRFTGHGTWSRLLAGLVAQNVASPGGGARVGTPETFIEGDIAA